MPRRGKPVSGPGALSQRTDMNQPVRVPTGGPYGQRKKLEETQRTMPLPAARGATAPPSPGSTSPAGLGGAAGMNLFGPTMRPGEPITEGAPVGPGSNGPMSSQGMDVDRYLQIMFNLTGSTKILRMMKRNR